MTNSEDQIGTLYQLVKPQIKQFVRSKVRIYGDSIIQMSKILSKRFDNDFKTEDVIDVLISVKIQRLRFGFSNNKDYTDSMCDLLSYTWIKENFDEYLKMTTE